MKKKRVGRCRSCNAKILWVKTALGKNIPVDWKEEIEGFENFDYSKMVAHFATCPDADKHRRRRDLFE